MSLSARPPFQNPVRSPELLHRHEPEQQYLNEVI
jgi:hypothetical protein